VKCWILPDVICRASPADASRPTYGEEKSPRNPGLQLGGLLAVAAPIFSDSSINASARVDKSLNVLNPGAVIFN
jgi:hypothetical protein